MRETNEEYYHRRLEGIYDESIKIWNELNEPTGRENSTRYRRDQFVRKEN